MIRYAFPLAAIALAGCTTYYDPAPAAPVTTSSGVPVLSAGPAPVSAAPGTTQRAGQGIIESISLASAPASASAGGTVAPVASGPYRVTVRMDDGNVQTLIVDNRAFLVGDRVQITPEGRLLRS